MFFYKIEENGVVTSVEARSSVSTDASMIEITENEYNALKTTLIYELINETTVKEENDG